MPDWGAFFSTRSVTAGVASGLREIVWEGEVPGQEASTDLDRLRGREFHPHHPQPHLTEDESEGP